MTDGMTIYYTEPTTIDERIRKALTKTPPEAVPSNDTYLSRLDSGAVARLEAHTPTATDLRTLADLADAEWNDIDQRYAHLNLTAADGYESRHQKRLRSDAAALRELADKQDVASA